MNVPALLLLSRCVLGFKGSSMQLDVLGGGGLVHSANVCH